MKQIIPENTLVNRIIVYPDYNSFGKLIFTLRKEKFDLAVNLRWTSEKCALITRLSGAKYRAGSGPQKFLWCYNRLAKVPVSLYHEVDRNLDIIKGIDKRAQYSGHYVHISEENNKTAVDYLKALNIDQEKLIGIHPGASSVRKAWLPEYFIEIGRRAVEEFNAKIIVTWGKNEFELAKKVVGGIGEMAVLSFETKNIGELAALIKKCKMFFSGCTGPMNVAVGVDTPTVALLGSTAPEDWSPYGEIHRYYKSPLVLDTYTDEEEYTAMQSIPLEGVWELFKKKWIELSAD